MRKSVLVLLLAAGGVISAQSLFGQNLKVEPAANPTGPGSSQVNWSMTLDGNALLSWLESDVLKYSIRKGGQWSEPRTIAAHRKFFHHPAEVPEVIAMPGGSYLAHWIEAPKTDSEAEFVYVSASRDGIKWTTPAMAHHDKSDVEHGLASMAANSDKDASLFWLQSLNGPDKPTSLMRSVISADGNEIKEEQLAPDVCECCPTAVTRTQRGLLLAYRAHTKDDIRDIAVTRLESGRWTSPKIVYPDKWQVDACPVNAASVAAKGEKVVISWYTSAGDKPRVELSLSGDSGATFSKAVVVSTGDAYGYTSIAIDDAGGAYVSWLERGADGAKVLARHVSADGMAGPAAQVAAGTRKTLGYPKIVRAGNETWIAWNTDSKAQTAKLGL
jgi:BNR repeat-like domain